MAFLSAKNGNADEVTINQVSIALLIFIVKVLSVKHNWKATQIWDYSLKR